MNTEQMFRLIDSILPFEACLYYQILPLALEGSHLKLGMVNPKDTSALDYAKRILAYLNCSLKPEQISVECHQTMLSAYLNYSGKSKNAPKEAPKQAKRPPQNAQPTLIVESPEHLSRAMESQSDPSRETQHQKETKIDAARTDTQPQAAPEQKTPTEKSDIQKIGTHLPSLEVQAQHLSDSIQVLGTLPPQQLLQELLGRVLIEGIGRLYFERQESQGRILWSQNGVLQSVLEKLPLSVLQGVINELKRMAHLSLIPVEKTTQVEIERRYQQNRLLLCLRVMPNKYGEEATLQVIRGAALKFYQQQQIDRLSRDALSLAQQLQRKVHEIRDRTKLTPGDLKSLPALNQMLDSLDQQLAAIRNEVAKH
jgi:type II secretory ATPase GspE/PulE/Tfp pilus assembly ATPase PilB-like protein